MTFLLDYFLNEWSLIFFYEGNLPCSDDLTAMDNISIYFNGKILGISTQSNISNESWNAFQNDGKGVSYPLLGDTDQKVYLLLSNLIN